MQVKYRLFIVDDHPVFRRGIRQLLQFANEIELVGEASGCDGALAGISSTHPHLVLLDLRLGHDNGLDVLRKVHIQWPDIKVVILTVSDAEEDLRGALSAGAATYLLKDMEPEELLDGIRHALSGKTILSNRLRSALGRALSGPDSHDRHIKHRLTRRESEIVAAVAQGKTNKMIAQLFGITEETVKVHLKRIFRRTHLRNRVELAVWVWEQSGHPPSLQKSP